MTGTHSLAAALADSAAAALVRRVADAQRIAEAIAGAELSLPPNFDPLQSGTCDVRDKCLILYVGSPASAAKLRQSLPQLLGWLNRQGFDLTEIKVRLQPERMSYRNSPWEVQDDGLAADASRAAQEPHPSAEGALALAEKLALTFPDSSVGAAAARLAASLRSRLARRG